MPRPSWQTCSDFSSQRQVGRGADLDPAARREQGSGHPGRLIEAAVDQHDGVFGQGQRQRARQGRRAADDLHRACQCAARQCTHPACAIACVSLCRKKVSFHAVLSACGSVNSRVARCADLLPRLMAFSSATSHGCSCRLGGEPCAPQLSARVAMTPVSARPGRRLEAKFDAGLLPNLLPNPLPSPLPDRAPARVDAAAISP